MPADPSPGEGTGAVPAARVAPAVPVASGPAVRAGSGASGAAEREVPPPRWVLVFVVVALALLMSSLDGTIVATALHAIEQGLHASINWTSWVITAYSVGLVLMLSLAGKLSVRFGQRRYFLFSVVLFAFASLCCGLATNIYFLIALRALQAAGGAGFTPSATAIVVERFGPARDKAVGLFGSIFPIGSTIGPIFGGLFVTYWSWRGIFFVNVPIGVVLVVMCLRYVPRDGERRGAVQGPLDLRGMALLGTGALALMLGISELGKSGTQPWSPPVVVPTALGVVGLVLFGRHLRTASDPFIPARLIAGRGFAAVNLINLLYGGATAGMIALVPLYAVVRYHIGVLGSGTLLTADGVAAIAASTAAAMGLRRTGYRLPLYLGSAVIALGVAALALRPLGMSAYAWLALATSAVGIGAGLSAPASRNAGLKLAPGQSAAIAALRSTGRQVGSIATISVTSALLARAARPGEVQAIALGVFALLLACCIPVVARVPEHRGSW